MKADYMNDVTDMEESVPAVLMRVVSELHDVAYLIERIEPQLAELHPEAGENTAQRMMVLQGIDLAVQKARGLADFLGQVTADMPEAASGHEGFGRMRRSADDGAAVETEIP